MATIGAVEDLAFKKPGTHWDPAKIKMVNAAAIAEVKPNTGCSRKVLRCGTMPAERVKLRGARLRGRDRSRLRV
jgi:hypothetical protein